MDDPAAKKKQMLGGSNAPRGREALLPAQPECSSSTTVPMDAAERGLNQLHDTQRLAADTEAMGMGILDQLGTQRNQLQSAAETRREAHEGLSVSNRLIRQMHNRATMMKLSLCMIISFLIIGIILIVWLHWFASDQGVCDASSVGLIESCNVSMV